MYKKKIQRNYELFLSEYSKLYNPEAFEYIKNNFWKCQKDKDIPDILMQVYSELGVFNYKNDIYLAHLNKIKSIFSVDCNVLEIGGGMIPSFASLLAREQLKIGSGTITVYDPMLTKLNSKYPNLKLVKQEFTKSTNIDNFDLLVGILPCDATEDIVQKSINKNKNFYVQMCGCTHFTREQIFKYGLSSKAYQEYIINLANELLDDEISITKLDNKFDIDYPVLYKKF